MYNAAACLLIAFRCSTHAHIRVPIVEWTIGGILQINIACIALARRGYVGRVFLNWELAETPSPASPVPLLPQLTSSLR